jgi:hypothetical protein
MQRPITIPTAITVSLSALLSMVMVPAKGWSAPLMVDSFRRRF